MTPGACRWGSKRRILVGSSQHRISVEPLIGFVGLDADIDAVAEADARVSVLGLIALREELEAVEQAGLGVAAVRVDVSWSAKTTLEPAFRNFAGVIRENIGVAAHFVDRPVAAAFTNIFASAPVDRERRWSRSCDGTHSGRRRSRPPSVSAGMSFTSRISTDFTQRSSLRPVGAGFEFTPPIRSAGFYGDFRSRDNQIRLAQRPLGAVDQRHRVGRSAGLPSGAPLSAHFAILAISRSLSEGSFL